MNKLLKSYSMSGLTKPLCENRGFSLLEVIIAITLFAIFLSSYVISQNQNIGDSIRLQENIILKRLGESVINEIILSPPKQLNSTLTLAPETKKFEEDDYENYQYTVEYKKIELPDLTALFSTSDENEEVFSVNQGMQKIIFNQVKNNVERMLWQVRIEVKNLDSENTYTLSTWIKNPYAETSISI